MKSSQADLTFLYRWHRLSGVPACRAIFYARRDLERQRLATEEANRPRTHDELVTASNEAYSDAQYHRRNWEQGIEMEIAKGGNWL